MDTKALEKFCPWARVELIDAVHLRCVRYALDDAGRAAHPADADVIGGTVLTPSEKTQRAALFERIERLNEERGGKGYAAFCEQQAYSWFNRFAAIRFMELHGYLSNNVRMLSAGSGAFEPECLRMASELDLPGLELAEVLDLITAGDDEALFRRILVAQMNELADCLPTVFGHVDAADALTLPDNLLARGEHDVLFHLVADIPEEAWQNREILGWMYQYYNSEIKQAFLDSKKKAAIEDIGAATQVFTPDWIVRYMVENTLGRLWMLNHPGSRLRNSMPFYIAPDSTDEKFIRIEKPEDITFCDPACGSGHILIRAFDLLESMYLEFGYRRRDIPRLILTNNLYGIEIDERAGQIASLTLAMCACELDNRFPTRGIQPNIQVLESIELDTNNLPRPLLGKKNLVESLAHLSEIGSLVAPDSNDLAAIGKAIEELSDRELFADTMRGQLVAAKRQLEALTRTYDVVVANPPYMGSGRFNPFMSKWIKANYPDEKGDLCFAFINRICGMKNPDGEAGITATNSWMFLSSSEASRLKVLASNEISSLVQLSVHGYKGIAAQVFAFTLIGKQPGGYKGGYIRLNDFDHHSLQEPKTLEAIQNPDCGWFYRTDASTFHDIPGSPIAYWASEGFRKAFQMGEVLGNVCTTRQGTATRDNNKWLRDWWEISRSAMTVDCKSPEDAQKAIQKWFPYNKGGQFRKWYGNAQHVINWFDDARRPQSDFTVKKNDLYFKQTITWGLISSSVISFRHQPEGSLFDVAGMSMACEDADQILQVLAFCNSSISQAVLQMIAPTLNYQIGDIMRLPIIPPHDKSVVRTVKECEKLSQTDWDTQETSWDFKRNPLI
ncbi:MAG: BREX-1 system adenine-specific DNA-methyltransferase PglX [Collinsella stercoris]|nr:BREX-1 system adenine-specific DNA-methyltransferase PglX [Collinsella stercoris]